VGLAPAERPDLLAANPDPEGPENPLEKAEDILQR